MKNIDKIIRASRKDQQKFHKALFDIYYSKKTRKKVKRAIAYHLWLKEYIAK